MCECIPHCRSDRIRNRYVAFPYLVQRKRRHIHTRCSTVISYYSVVQSHILGDAYENENAFEQIHFQILNLQEEILCRQEKLETLITDFEIDVDSDVTPNEIADKYEKITEEFERIKDYQKTIGELTAKHKILFEKLEAQCAVSNALHNKIPTQNNSCQQVPVPVPRTSVPFSWIPISAPRMLIPISQTKTTMHETNHSQPIRNHHNSHSLNFNDYPKTIKNDTNENYTRLHTQHNS
ncbi:hypothetical protein PV328_012124, partial [Microctonus aethiopoides]